MKSIYSFPIATALRLSVKGYNLDSFKHDIIAGLVVSLIALPLAMALAIAVELPPQHGIYTAIVAGIIAALFGGSRTQVSGPTAAFVVIVAPIVAKYGLHGIIWCQIIAGVILIIMGVFRFGRYINYVPYPVTTGFTAGIALVIATLAMNDFFGLGIEHLQGDYIEKVAIIFNNFGHFKFYEFTIGISTLLVIIFFPKITGKIPSQIVGIIFGTLLAYVFARTGHDVATIGSKFTYELEGVVKQGIPPFAPSLYLPTLDVGHLLTIPNYAEFKNLLVPSLVIAILAALESLLSATVADSMAGGKHNPNSELNGIGLANIFSGLAAGIPATGAIARTSINIHSGARTPIAAALHGLFILLYVLMFAPLINYVPMAALAALLIHTAYKMSHIKQFVHSIKVAHKSDTFVLLACFGLTAFVDMVVGVTFGIVLASLLFMQRVASLTQVRIEPVKYDMADNTESQQVPDNVMLSRINGPLFFGNVEKAFENYNFIHDHIEKVVIDLQNVPMVDITGVMAMVRMVSSIAKEGRSVYLCGDGEVVNNVLTQIPAPLANFVKHYNSVNEALKNR